MKRAKRKTFDTRLQIKQTSPQPCIYTFTSIKRIIKFI